jgi:hypothetical protein
MHRKAAIRLLGGVKPVKAGRRPRRRKYGPEVVEALRLIWEVGDRMCGKLLVGAMPGLLEALERHGELRLAAVERKPLLEMSAATMDRLLRPARRAIGRQPRRKSPSATGLKAQVPVRTWSEWAGVAPGSLQADLVLHCGESTEGFYLTTLTAVDVATGWTEMQVVWGMGKERVRSAVHHVRQKLPFTMRELHNDNGSEFLNYTLRSWCLKEKIAWTRGRGYQKNDQAVCRLRALHLQRGVPDHAATPLAAGPLQQLLPAGAQDNRQRKEWQQGREALRPAADTVPESPRRWLPERGRPG